MSRTGVWVRVCVREMSLIFQPLVARPRAVQEKLKFRGFSRQLITEGRGAGMRENLMITRGVRERDKSYQNKQ